MCRSQVLSSIPVSIILLCVVFQLAPWCGCSCSRVVCSARLFVPHDPPSSHQHYTSVMRRKQVVEMQSQARTLAAAAATAASAGGGDATYIKREVIF